MKIEKTPRGYLLSANGGNRIEFYREFNGVEAWACAAFDELMNERDTLRAKLAEMEQQEPVAKVRINSITGNPSVDFIPGHRYLHHNSSLYALPGAQPAPSIRPAALFPVIAWLRNGCDPMKAADELEMLAEAPEAKP